MAAAASYATQRRLKNTPPGASPGASIGERPMNPFLEQTDPEIARIVNDELARQRDGIELIASENFTSPAVLAAQGSVLTNKYAEGYPGKRYYGGCEDVDRIETLAIERAKALFGAEHANVQPHAGSQANLAAYLALANPGDRLMGMDLNHGGHLTHGYKVNFSGRLFECGAYGVDPKTERLDMAQVREQVLAFKPKILVVGASAYPRTLDFEAWAKIAREAGAFLIADMAHIAGLVAAGLHPNPVPHCDVVTSTSHKTLRGPRAGFILCKAEHAKKIDSAVFPGMQGGPLMHVVAGKAVCFHEAAQPAFKAYMARTLKNAAAMAAAFARRGWRVVSGGTDNHLLLVDVSSKGFTGKEAEDVCGRVGMTVNKNQIPFDKNPPAKSSGVRLGAAAATTRGLDEAAIVEVSDIIMDALEKRGDDAALAKLRERTASLTKRFPLYPGL
jgi:glycine hydroxymethyltransferase